MSAYCLDAHIHPLQSIADSVKLTEQLKGVQSISSKRGKHVGFAICFRPNRRWVNESYLIESHGLELVVIISYLLQPYGAALHLAPL